MRQRWTEKVKGLVRPWLFKTFNRSLPFYECPVCKYHGPFKDRRTSRRPGEVREAAKCVRCGAAERHRVQWLVIDEKLTGWATPQKSMLHIAPEYCLQPKLQSLFGTYHTSDLFRKDCDFQEDIQKMSFKDASYDCVFVSRVLTNVPDHLAAIREVRRVLKPGGIAIFSEAYIHDKTIPTREGNRRREMGLDLLDELGRHFSRVEQVLSNRYDPKHQLMNRVRVNGVVDVLSAKIPDKLRVPDVGFMELVAVCYV